MDVMPVVNVYKYLGIVFSTRLSFNAACCDLASKAKNALSVVQKLSKYRNNMTLKVYLKLFDAQIQPIALYGAELRGIDKVAIQCESVHLLALKKFLGVGMKTPNDFVYGETDRYPIYLNAAVKCIRYWFKLLIMDADRLPYKAYRMLFLMDEKGKRNWVSNVRCKLYQYGFGYVWLNQGVSDVDCFLQVFRERLIDCKWQEWNFHIQNSERFSFYRTFCTVHDVKTYILLRLDRHLKVTMTMFRMGISAIAVHANRYKLHSVNDLICPLCRGRREDELHFVLCCPVLNELRHQYILPKFYRNPCLFRLSMLMASTNQHIVKNLSIYLFKALRLRSVVVS